MLKRTLACALFAITGHVYSADIQVTTLIDEDKDDTVCSLREAVFFLNNRTQTLYENGYHGCGNKDASSTIILERNKEYNLNQAIQIKASMTISTAASGDFNDNKKGLGNATIKMVGTDRLFTVDDGSVENSLLAVNFTELNLQGGTAKVNNGGLILNREALTIQYSRLTGGNANNGGAIYNAGVLSEVQKTVGTVAINNSIIQNNKADQGAAIYTDMPYYRVTQSVIKDNEVTMSGSSIIYANVGFKDPTIGINILYTGASGLRNSTVFNNRGGYIANIREGIVLNNVTILRNDLGLYLDAPKWIVKTTTTDENDESKETNNEYVSASISNSIIVGNGENKCSLVPDALDETIVQSNLMDATCDFNKFDKVAERKNFNIGNNKIIAGNNIVDQKCDSPPANGLLCPYYIPKDQMLGFFKPRLLTSYIQLSDSLIVNKGRVYSDGGSVGLASCEGIDQRGKSRSGYDELCDLGAIELVINRSDIPIVGQDILYGEIASFSIADSLLDGELLDPVSCEEILGKRSDGQSWQWGCLEVKQTVTPSKGKVTLDQDGNIIYVPNSNWHGADKFNLRVMTTTTRLNDVSNYYIEIPATIVQDPPNNFKSKTVNVSGGGIGFGVIFFLIGMVGIRRVRS